MGSKRMQGEEDLATKLSSQPPASDNLTTKPNTNVRIMELQVFVTR